MIKNVAATTYTNYLQDALDVIAIETRALDTLRDSLGDAFVMACRKLLACKGHVILTGMGKSGHIARKIAATLASTGTPAFFVHPGEASHGDLGMITSNDVVIALSNSGETDELLLILPAIKRNGTPLIAITGNAHSSLAHKADLHLFVGNSEEACPLGLAPTSSTTASLVLGDALAVTLLRARGFTADDFARSHPAGRLGRQLLWHISDIMHAGDDVPRVHIDASLSDALLEVSQKRLGITAVVDADNTLQGIFTDGDLRRALDSTASDLRDAKVRQFMSTHPKTVKAQQLAVEAAHLMESHQIHALLVVDDQNKVIGAFNIHDLLRARVL